MLRNLSDRIMVSLEWAIKFQLEQFCINSGEQVMGQDQTWDVLVVLLDWIQGREWFDLVVGKIQHSSPRRDHWKGGEPLWAAVDQHGKGGHSVWCGCKVMEITSTHGGTEGVNLAGVILHHFDKRRHLVRVFYPTLLVLMGISSALAWSLSL